MPAIAAITINDGAATPVARTFGPIKVDAAQIAKYQDKSGGVPVGYPTITLQVREPNKQTKSYRAVGKVVFPVLEQTSASTATGIQPAPIVAYNLLFNFDFTLPERSSLQDRKHIKALAQNLISNALMTTLVEGTEGIW